MASNPTKVRKPRPPAKPRPMILVYKSDSPVEIVRATRDAFSVVEAIQADPTLKFVKLELPTVRRTRSADHAQAAE